MYYHEEKKNLLSVPQGYYLAHCISADFAMGAGVAKQIDELFDMRAALKELWGGEVEAMENCCLPVGNVLNLVTKDKHWQKPTLQSLREALEDMKLLAQEQHIRKIAMPKIGCGLDRLNWDDVSPIIQEVFDKTDIEILVCYL